MSTSSISVAFAIWASSSFKARNSKTSLPFNFPNTLRCSSPPSLRPLSGHRKLYPVKAKLLEENEEVVAEKLFRTKSFPRNEIEEVGESCVNSSSSGLER